MVAVAAMATRENLKMWKERELRRTLVHQALTTMHRRKYVYDDSQHDLTNPVEDG